MPAVRLTALSDLHAIFVFTHDSFYLGEDGPTHQPIEQLATLRATPNTIVVRPADALETLEAWKLAIAGAKQPWVIVLTRQKVPFLGAREARVDRGAYVLADPPGGAPDLMLIATGSEVSLAVDTKTLLDARGVRTRVVSMPSWELFEAQDHEYKESVLPSAVTARISIEAASTLGWARYVGDRGIAFGIDHFGQSAPAAALAKDFGFTAEHVAQLALDSFALAAR
jgi:transketolase